MKYKVFEYNKCSTCKKALKFLSVYKLDFTAVPIVENPPTVEELNQMLNAIKKSGGSIKNLFNTSGVQYRELKMADKLKAGLSEPDAIKLLSKNGKLIKRPFLLGKGVGLVGFVESDWEKLS